MHPSVYRLTTFRRSLTLAAIALTWASGCFSQAAPQQVVVDAQTLHDLLARVNQLEARVKELEAAKAPPSTDGAAAGEVERSQGPSLPVEGASAPAIASVADVKPAHAPTAAPSEQDATDNMDRMDVSKTLLRIRGFGDVSLHGSNQEGDTTSFSLGQLDLFVTSDVSDRFRFLSEIVFEAGPNTIYGVKDGEKNSFGVDLERYLIQYSQNDYFNISAGRGHTAIGYYNTAYHHSSWLQTATGRPFLFDFEDRGGILPIHMVGVSVSGQIPAGSLGLHYVAEVGNGRASRNPLQEEPVQNEIDDQSHKAFNFALFSRPEDVRGLQAGLSFYRDVLAPANQPRVDESIIAAHAVLIRPRYEWLNEVVLDRHVVHGTHAVFNTPGCYTQLSRQFGAYRPYMRYQYINVPMNEPIYPDVSLRHGPSFGVRYDPSESVALKLQYDLTMMRDQPSVNELAMQLGFTF